jgi:hypothetical protein
VDDVDGAGMGGLSNSQSVVEWKKSDGPREAGRVASNTFVTIRQTALPVDQ